MSNKNIVFTYFSQRCWSLKRKTRKANTSSALENPDGRAAVALHMSRTLAFWLGIVTGIRITGT